MLLSNQIYTAPPDSGKVILGRNLPSLLDEACLNSPNSQALNQWIEVGWQSFSNQEFRTTVQELALGLLGLQLNKGERIALLMHSDVNFCIADLGSLLAGLVNVPIDLTQTIEHIIFILRHAEAKALFISNLDLLYQIVPYLWNIPNLKTVIVADVPNDWQARRQKLSRQQNSNEDINTLIHENEEISTNLCLHIPTLHSQESLDQSFSAFPQCIQVFSVQEICAMGKTLNSEDRHQQLLSKLAANDLATIIYIPAITGEPQGVMLTHENLSANALAMFSGIPDLKFGNQEVILSFLPLTHVFARVLLYGHINYGHSVYFSTSNRVIKHLKEVQPTIFATVPLFLEKIYSKLLESMGGMRRKEKRGKMGTQKGGDTENISKPLTASPPHRLFPPVHFLLNWALKLAQRYELGQQSQLRYALILKLVDRMVFSQWRAVFGGRLKYLISGGAALKAEIANLFTAAGMTILQGYGLTETSSALSCNRGKFNRAGTVGVAIAGVEIAIAQDGEILTRSPYITQGYYKNPDATQQLIDSDGWLHTGDLGEFTSEGFLKITGLKKSRFKLSTGKYVTPQPIESKLKKSPLVANAVTVGSERKFCAMLIFPNLDALQSYALSIGIDLPIEALLKHPCIIALYQALVDEANCHLPYWSTVKRFQLINTTLTVENGMLIANQQVNRAKVVEVFTQEIDAMFRDKERRGRHGDGETQRHRDGEMDISSCPVIPTVSCPAFAQSLNS